MAVKGDCMAPECCDGDFVIVDPDSTVLPGSLAVIHAMNRHKYIKRLFEVRSGLHVFERNDTSERLVVRNDQIAIVHLVIGCIRASEVAAH